MYVLYSIVGMLCRLKKGGNKLGYYRILRYWNIGYFFWKDVEFKIRII